MKAILILVLALAGCAPAQSAPDDADDSARWQSVLRQLDAARERAFVRGDAGLLGRVYVPGSDVRRADARLIRAYERRGLELDAVPMRVRDVEVVSRAERRVLLRVLDRLGAVRVRAPAGGAWRPLPRDRPSEHVITLTNTRAGWRIAGIRRVAG
ncbi:hypothetical protein [Solicola gregarius]|uniref:Nuclear transport factor 2 family protein n=1 Tax=Solicola gregarius TaxID=2908642 RepID=A0AA46TIH0_9ACTN|nr:hypothetical protein [Solicola gregarius]UYM05447.1 hypothetical protein L0C25_23545 [Solicola gregarius]